MNSIAERMVAATSGWTVADIPDQTGRVAVVTGGNGGLGLETVRALAGAGAHVVMAARNQSKAADALVEIQRTHPDAAVEVVELDLGSLASIERAAEHVNDAHPTIDLLINNAGLMAVEEGRTEDGFERQFGVNHLGHWALTARLLPAIMRGDASRIVTVTSTAHHMGTTVDPDNPNLDGNYSPWGAYGQSKLANFHFGLGLHRRFTAAGSNTASLLAHPGLTNSDLQATSVAESSGGFTQQIAHGLTNMIGMKTPDGARSQLRAATDPGAAGGEFYGPLWVNFGPPVRKPILRTFHLDESIETLWSVSEHATGLAIDP